MKREWLLRAVTLRPAKNTALKSVVDTWHIPPPKESSSLPRMITGASLKPFSEVRLPTIVSKSNSSPGARSVLLINSAARCTFARLLLEPPKCVVYEAVSYTHLRAHETDSYLVCRLLL